MTTLPGTDPADDPTSPEFEAWRWTDALDSYHYAIAALRERHILSAPRCQSAFADETAI